MISSQVIKSNIEELKAITKIDLGVWDLDGRPVVATFDTEEIAPVMITGFADSQADSQVIGPHHLMKIMDEEELLFILDAKGIAEDNMLLVDIYNRAKKLHIECSMPRAVFLIETGEERDTTASELLNGMFTFQNGDYITAVDESSVILIKALTPDDTYDKLEQIANTIVDMMSMEAMLNVRVAYGTIVGELKEVSKSYKEAKMALDVGKIFYAEKKVTAYNTLGIGRLIYQLPVNLCKIFIDEIFGENVPDDLDEEILTTINKFFENNLNVSETSRQLFIHRNTLVYRLEKLQKSTGLDVRTFDDALTFKIALMVVNYMKYLNSLDY